MTKNQSPWQIEFYSPSGTGVDGSPIGNGDIGAMIQARQQNFTLHLAKSNIWYTQRKGSPKAQSFFPARDFDTIKRLVKAARFEQVNELYSKATSKGEAKYMLLPAACMQIWMKEPEIELAHWSRKLDMKTGTVSLNYKTRQRQVDCRFFASSDYDVIASEIKCNAKQLRYEMNVILEPQQRPDGVKIKFISEPRNHSVYMYVKGYDELEYAVGIRVEGHSVRVSADKEQGCLTIKSRKSSNTTFVYTAIACNLDEPNPLETVKKLLAKAAKTGFRTVYNKHIAWWRTFWNRARISIPDYMIYRQHNLGMYLLASCSRPGCRAPGLQGLWAFKPEGSGWNDYTNNFNSEAFFWPAFTGNQLQLLDCYYKTFKAMLPQIRKDTRKYYKARGACYPLACSPNGYAAPGYVTHYHWAGMSAFIAQNFWWGYLYSRDVKFLKTTAYPVMKECSLFYLDRIDIENGKAVINASTNPEEGEGCYEAWGTNPTMDIALVRELLAGLVESTKILDCDHSLAKDCKDLLKRMPDYPTRNGYLIEMQDREFKDSHRHGSVLAPIYPCCDLSGISSPGRKRLARASLERFINKGRWCWEGFTYPWIALVAARLSQGRLAAQFLKDFIGVGCLQCGGLHLNDDFAGTMKTATGKKNFTLEGNTMYSAAVYEMLLQSHSDTIQVFPAVPDNWKEVSFENLRAEGAFLVSAQRKNGRTKEVLIKSLAGARCRVLNPFGNDKIVIKRIIAGKKAKVDFTIKGKCITFETSRDAKYIIAKS